MKNYILLISLFLIENTYAQIGPEQIITTDMNQATSVYAADIDGDGDLDVLAAALGNDKLTWYENIDGQGSFSSENFISNIANGAFAIIAADIDNDGDNDVLNASLYRDSLVWHKNIDSQGTFIPRFIDNGVENFGVWWIYPGDMDGDGDIDLLYCYAYDDKIVIYENLDGLGSFGGPQIITEEVQRPTSAYFCDLDGDGDLDILSSSLLDDKIAWYENIDGLGDYGTQQIITTEADQIFSVFPVDIDGDGDLDALSGSAGADKVAWYENLNGSGDFGSQQVLLTELEEPRMVYSSDLDGDGDMDVLVASEDDDKIAWFENTNGLGSFGAQQTISENADGASSVYAADIDGDGDQDILSSSWYDGKIAWYENMTVLSVDENSTSEFLVYPNPAMGIIHVQTNVTILQIEVYSNLAQRLLSNSNENHIDISSLKPGLYYIKIKSENGNSSFRKVLKQ